jgi:hypothetical protein
MKSEVWCSAVYSFFISRRNKVSGILSIRSDSNYYKLVFSVLLPAPVSTCCISLYVIINLGPRWAMNAFSVQSSPYISKLTALTNLLSIGFVILIVLTVSNGGYHWIGLDVFCIWDRII